MVVTRKEQSEMSSKELEERIMELISGANDFHPIAESVRPTSQTDERTPRVKSWSEGKVSRADTYVDMADESEEVRKSRSVLTRIMRGREELDATF